MQSKVFSGTAPSERHGTLRFAAREKSVSADFFVVSFAHRITLTRNWTEVTHISVIKRRSVVFAEIQPFFSDRLEHFFVSILQVAAIVVVVDFTSTSKKVLQRECAV